MATVTKDFAENIRKYQGYYNGDSDNSMGDNPRCLKIVEYTNKWGGQAFGMVMDGDRDPDRYEYETEFVQKPRVFWQFEA